ncbi:unnamed protein product [Coregonus sp. 'balchen']|nr:unnamed protein product [Coregonus sp. 'balchen']
MFAIHSLAGLLLLVIIQSSWQVPLQEAEDNSSLETADSLLKALRGVSNVKRHSEGTFSNDYSKYQEDRRAQDFVQWLMNSKRSGAPSKRHADGTYTSDVSTYLQDQAAKDFVSWLKSGRARRESAEESRGNDPMSRRHVDGSFTSDVNKVLDSMAAKELELKTVVVHLKETVHGSETEMHGIQGEGETEDSYKISKIAAHVPDLVVYSTLTNDIPYAENFHGVLLFADKFSLSSKKGYGADELTRTLNSYIGEIVSHILDAGGDILNYAGDAILALWTVERIQLSEVISLVVKCSLNIQDQCGVRETEVGWISAGKLSKVIVGDEISQYFVVIGRAVDEVRLAEGLAVASTIILSPNAWELCERDNIAIDPIENERAVKVRYIKREPRFSVEKYQESIGTHVEHENVTRDCVRKASRLMPNAELEKTFRKYIMKTVLQKMRPATIVFVNMQFKGGESDQEQCMTIHQAAIGIGQQIVKHHGRGCTFLCLFGLPGDKREDESAHALQAAYGVHDLCQKEIRSLKTVSVGVTTGPVFCGVVGHPVRHEYTVIGRKVNLAARLMMHYPGMVSCDSETCYYSKLPAFYFNELPKKAMKGVKNPGALYQFMANKHQITVGKAPMSVEREEGYPLLGREKEIEVYSSVLKGFLEARAAGHKNYNNVLIYEGPIGYGKSRLLAEVVYRTAKDGVRVISFELAKTDIKQSNYALQTLLAIVMSVQNCKSYAERERVLLSKILDSKMRQNLCLLNDILLVKFPVSKDVSLMDSQTKNKKMRNYFLELFCKFAEEEPCVYVLDQAHFVDQASWAFLLEACKRASVLLCMALLPHTSQSGAFPELSRIIKDPRTLYLNLPGLEPPRSHGVPYYCEELLKSLYLGNLIVMEEVEKEDEAKDIDILFPEPTLVVHCSKPSQVWQEEDARAGALGPPKASMLKSRKITALDHFVDRALVCFVGEAAKFHEVPIPLTLKGIPADQMVVKCAAIIGHTITTQMLINILPESENHDKLNLSLTSLFKSGTFECGSKPKQFTQQLTKESECWGALNCYCVQDSQEDIREEVSGKASVDGVWRCRVMRFCTALVKETAYELWLKEQKREIHQKCASYLLKQAHRCRDCGMAEFIFGHKAAIGNNLIEIHPSLLNIQESGEALFLGQSTLGLPKETIQLNQVSPLHPNSEEDEFLLKLDSRVDEYKTTVDRSRKCRCAQVMECVLCPMVRHCTGVGDVPKTFYYLLETAAASAFLSNNLKALSYLNEAKIILDNLKVGKPAFETADPKVKGKINNFERACVFRLRGEVLYNTGQMEEAESMFASALRLLNRRLPTNRVAVSLKYVCEKMKSLCCRSKNFDNPGEKKLAFLHEQVCCLSYMWQIGCMRRAPKDMLNASLAITMEMNSAQRTAEENKIIFSCIDYLQYCQLSGLDDQCKSYERMLCGNFVELSDCMEGLTLTSYFIRTLSIVKLCSGALHDSIQYGLRAEKISKLTNRRGPDMLVITVLHTPLLLTQRYEECVQLMQSLEYQGNRTRISTAKGWFYAPSSIHSINGVVMFLECHVLLFRKALMYAPRVLHLRAYMYLLAGHEALATAILNKAISWFGVFRQSTSDWFASTLTMPSWEEAKGMDPEELTHTRYTLMGVGSEIWADNSSLYLAPKAEDTQLLKGQG